MINIILSTIIVFWQVMMIVAIIGIVYIVIEMYQNNSPTGAGGP